MNNRSDGSTASYYELPANATELQHLISHRDMNAQIGEIFRACYRYGMASHSDRLRDAKKIKFYIDAEIERLLADSVTPSAAIARHPVTPNVASYPAVEVGVDTRFDQSGRQEVVEQNGNDGLAYQVPDLSSAPKGATHWHKAMQNWLQLRGQEYWFWMENMWVFHAYKKNADGKNIFAIVQPSK